MRWAHGYVALWLLCIALFSRDLHPLLSSCTIPTPAPSIYAALLLYIFAVALLGILLPGKHVSGVPLRDGTRLKYKCNGLLVIGVVVTALATVVWHGLHPGSWVADHFADLFVASNVFALALSLYLCVKGRLSRPRNWLTSPSVWHDFVMGAELNPFVARVNLKFFSYRPAMAGWLIVNLSFLAKQWQTLGFITARMLLYQIVTAWYIWDYFVHAPNMLSTWDIIAEHFGLMLVWGDYVFIVFAFSLQNLFLLHDTRPMAYAEVFAIITFFVLGFAIFRGANSQKHQFKTNPKAPIWGKPPLTVGDRLLASGFWGMARHMNYTGDVMLAFSFCLPCGFSSAVPYF